MAKNAPLGLAALVMIAGSLVLLWFVILAGVRNTTPLNKTYFLRADTSGIPGARDVTQWTYFYYCGRNNQNCGPAHPAPPFGQAWDGRADGVPSSLIGGHAGHTTSTKFYYMWRFGWVFFLIALFFEVLAFFGGFLACCGRLGSAISGFLAAIALFFLTIAVSLMTATFVEARNAFNSSGRSASLGRYAFGFSWGAWAALFIATVLFCVGMRGDKSARSSGFVTNGAAGGGGRGKFWNRRHRSVRSRSSYDGRRVKDDYS